MFWENVVQKDELCLMPMIGLLALGFVDLLFKMVNVLVRGFMQVFTLLNKVKIRPQQHALIVLRSRWWPY